MASVRGKRSRSSPCNTEAYSRCGTWTTCPSPTSPIFSTARSTPPKRCSCAPGWRSAAPTRNRRTLAVPDPFEALRTAPTPIDPDLAFAARLRARVARALHPPVQGEPTMTLQTPETTNQVRQGDISYLSLWVPDLERAARFYADVLGWRYPATQDWWARTVEGQSSALGLSQLSGTAQYMRSVEGVPLPQTLTPTAYVVFVVDDVDAAVERVRAAGGHGSAVKDQPY